MQISRFCLKIDYRKLTICPRLQNLHYLLVQIVILIAEFVLSLHAAANWLSIETQVSWKSNDAIFHMANDVNSVSHVINFKSFEILLLPHHLYYEKVGKSLGTLMWSNLNVRATFFLINHSKLTRQKENELSWNGKKPVQNFPILIYSSKNQIYVISMGALML